MRQRSRARILPLQPTEALLTGQRIDGHAHARVLRERARAGVAALIARGGTPPRLFALGSAADPVAERYLALKTEAARDAGITIDVVLLPRGASTDDALALLDTAALDAAVHAIFVQYPLPGIDVDACYETIPSLKDVDGVSSASRDRLSRGLPAFMPATAAAILELVSVVGLDLNGAPTVIVDGDEGIAMPLVLALTRAGADAVRTESDVEALRDAQLIVFPGGVPAGVTAAALPDDAVVVDAGYTAEPRGTSILEEAGPRLRAWVSPRGGVGPVVVELLLLATLRAAESQMF